MTFLKQQTLINLCQWLMNTTLDLYWQCKLCWVQKSAGQNSPQPFVSSLGDASLCTEAVFGTS